MADQMDHKAKLDEYNENKDTEKDQEKEFLENDACLEKPPQKDDVKTRMRQRFACLSLTWKGLIVFFILLILIILLLVTVIGLAITVGIWGSYENQVCLSPPCLRIAAEMVSGVNSSVDPCMDFFEYACGGWKGIHGIPPPPTTVNYLPGQDELKGRGKDSVLDQVIRNYYDSIRRLLNTAPYTSNSSSVTWKVKAFYDSCMNLDNIESVETAPLKRIIDRLRGWKVLSTWVLGEWDFNRILRSLHEEFGVYPFFRLAVEADVDSSVIQILPAGLGLPHRNLYYRSPHDKIVEAYKRMLNDIVIFLGATVPAAHTFADDVFHFEKRIAEIYPDNLISASKTRQLITLRELKALAPRINWVEHIGLVFRGANSVRDTTQVVANKTYLKEISRIISTTDNGALNNYMLWKLAHKYSAYLSEKFQIVLQKFDEALTGTNKPMDRWEFCIQELEKLFPAVLTSMYVHSNISSDVYGNVTELTKEVISKFAERIKNYNWMDSETRDIALRKISIVQPEIRPPPTVNSTAINNYYSRMNVYKTDFFQNILNGMEFLTEQTIHQLKNSSDLFWLHQINRSPFFIHQKKKLVIPHILLQRPFYDLNQPSAMNFGGLGMLIARLLVQTFEDADEYDRRWRQQGFHFTDDWGRVTFVREPAEIHHFKPQWWSNYTLDRYEKHQNCVAEEYFKYHIRDVLINGYRRNLQVNGNQTVDDNIADLGGLTIAYDAFERWRQNHKWEKGLPAFHNRTHYHLFFLNYAQTFCSVEKTSSIMNEFLLSRIPPNKIRVNGVLSHLRSFSWAFGCSWYSPMTSSHTCDAW